MPELPEVETIARGLRKHLLGRQILRVETVGHRIFRGKSVDFPSVVDGRTVRKIHRHGKYLLLAFSPESKPATFLLIHLGMTGRLLWLPADAPTQPHTHFIFHLKDSDHHLRYADIRRFGWMDVIPQERIRAWPADAWETPVNEIFEILRKTKGFAKHTLLSQKAISGLGNIYVDESLFRAGIHPQARMEKVSTAKMKALCQCIRDVLAESLNLGGTSVYNYVDAYGQRGGFVERLQIYGRDGEICSCGRVIKKAVIAGRGTHFCPNCQKRR